MNRDDEKLIRNIKEKLDQQVDGLDARTLTRLRQARATALADGGREQRQWRWQPVSAFASVAVLVLAVWVVLPVNRGGDPSVAVMDDMELLATADDLEMYQDIDFYAWLEAQDGKG